MRSIITCIFIFLSLSVFCQNSNEGYEFTNRHKNMFIGGFGGNLGFGINFDSRLEKGKLTGPGFRIGLGGIGGSYLNNTNVLVVAIPIEVNYLLLSKGRNSMVTGMGIIPYSNLGGQSNVDALFFELDNSAGIAALYAAIGFRAQPFKNGFMFQVRWEPMVMGNGQFNPFWFGIGMGVGFK